MTDASEFDGRWAKYTSGWETGFDQSATACTAAGTEDLIELQSRWAITNS